MLIGEVARHSGISTRMLRHYDRVGLLTPTGRSIAGYREYADADLERLFHIEGLRTLGLSLAQIGDVLAADSFTPTTMINDLLVRVRDQIAQAQVLMARLETVQRADPRTWTDVLRTVALLRELNAPLPSRRQQVALTVDNADPRDLAFFVRSLLQEHSDDVAGALQWAIARAGDTAVPLLITALRSDDQLHRRRALDALEKIGTPGALDSIATATDHQDTRVRTRAVLVHARAGRPGSIPLLVDLIGAGLGDVEAADALREIVLRHDLEQEAVTAIAGALRDGEAGSRRRLAAALSEIPGHAAEQTLESLLNDVDRGTALTAKAVLANRGNEADDS